MEIIIVDKLNLLSAEAKSKTISRAHGSFARYDSSIKSLRITVHDINGPRGGVDKECRVAVRLHKMKDTQVTARAETLSKAISSAMDRAVRSVGRTFEQRMSRESGHLLRFWLEV